MTEKPMRSAEAFFRWAFNTRANTVMQLNEGKEMTQDKVFLSFCSHNPGLISNGPAGLNASIKGFGFVPKEEYLEEVFELYMNHINAYDGDDKEHSKRGLKLLAEEIYHPDKHYRVDLGRVVSLEMAKKHSWDNLRVNPAATLLYYQPPMISYEIRGQVRIFDEAETGKKELYQQFVNAQHDVYHRPDTNRWLRYPAYVFDIEEVYDNCVSKEGFGTQMQFPF